MGNRFVDSIHEKLRRAIYIHGTCNVESLHHHTATSQLQNTTRTAHFTAQHTLKTHFQMASTMDKVKDALHMNKNNNTTTSTTQGTGVHNNGAYTNDVQTGTGISSTHGAAGHDHGHGHNHGIGHTGAGTHSNHVSGATGGAYGTGHSTHATGNTATGPGSTTAGPHSSNIANKVDPRVDSGKS